MNKAVVLIVKLLIIVVVQAISAEQIEFEPIIVTANKRAEDSQNVGISTRTLFGDELIKQGAYDLRSISESVPGLDVKSAEGDHNQIITIRGVGLRAGNANISPSVGVHTDGVYQATPAYLSFPLFDIERIEILKGPQGTLYGKNTTGGTINIITRKPTQQREGYASLSYGRFNDVRVESAVGGGLTDSLSGRFAVMANYSDGYQLNQGSLGNEGFTQIPGTIPALSLTSPDNDWGGANKIALRGTLNWKASSAFKSTIGIHALRDRSEIIQRKLKGSDALGFSDPSTDPRDVVTNVEPEVFINQVGGYLETKQPRL